MTRTQAMTNMLMVMDGTTKFHDDYNTNLFWSAVMLARLLRKEMT